MTVLPMSRSISCCITLFQIPCLTHCVFTSVPPIILPSCVCHPPVCFVCAMCSLFACSCSDLQTHSCSLLNSSPAGYQPRSCRPGLSVCSVSFCPARPLLALSEVLHCSYACTNSLFFSFSLSLFLLVCGVPVHSAGLQRWRHGTCIVL